MGSKSFFATVAIALLLLLPLAGAQGRELSSYVGGEHYEHLEILGYRTVEQFQALAYANPDMLCDELGINYGELDQILSGMPSVRYLEAVYPEEQPMGLLLEEEPMIINYEDLLYQQPYYTAGGVVDLMPYCPPIRDQVGRGTCAAFSGVAFLEYEYINYAGYNDLDLSEQYFFYACKQRDGSPGSDGTTMTAVRDVVMYDGACLEATWPYNPYPTGDPAQGPAPVGAAQEAKNFVYPDVEYYGGWFFKPSIDTLKASIESGHIISFGVPVYDSWYSSPECRRTGEVTMPLSNDKLLGGHAMDLVGYVDDGSYPGGGYFLLRNSWGMDWAYESVTGSPGYGTIPYAYIGNYWNGGFIAA